MNRNTIIAVAVAVAGVAAYFLYRNRFGGLQEDGSTSDTSPRSHHLTSAFSRAKQRAVSA